MDGNAVETSSWNPHARRVWDAYNLSDRTACPPAPYMAPVALPDLTPCFPVGGHYEASVQCILHPVLREGNLIYSSSAASADVRRWICDAPSEAGQLDGESLEADATFPLMHVLNLRFAGLPEDWDVQLKIRRLERGATVNAVLFAIEQALKKPLAESPERTRMDVMRALTHAEQWRVRIRSDGDDEFTVFLA